MLSHFAALTYALLLRFPVVFSFLCRSCCCWMLPQSPTQSLHSFVFRSQHMCVAAASASASAAAAAAGWKCCNFAAYPGNYVSRRSSSSTASAVEAASATSAAAAAASTAAAAARTTTTAMPSQWIRRQIKTKLNEKYIDDRAQQVDVEEGRGEWDEEEKGGIAARGGAMKRHKQRN